MVEIPEPEVVYHYTTIDAMTKIATGACFWATSVNYLNDVSEGNHFIDLTRERIAGFCLDYKHLDENIFDESIFDELLKTGESHFRQEFESRPFVASFSRRRDSLSQWRAYCPNGNGVAIGFKIDCLKRAGLVPLAKQLKMAADPVPPKTDFGAVKYIDRFSTDELDSEIKQAVLLAKQLAPHDKSKAALYFQLIIQRTAFFKKHGAFSNEDEYRLLVESTYSECRFVSFRATSSTLVPYVVVSIPQKHSARLEMPVVLKPSFHDPLQPFLTRSVRSDFIDSVIIGPSTDMTLTLKAVDCFFRKLNMRVEVKPSDAPYRDR